MSIIYHVRLSKRAKRDIAQVFEWFCQEQAQLAGSDWVHRIFKAISTLSEYPLRCASAHDQRNPEARQLIFGKGHGQYRILFSIENKTVHILHIHHSARNKAKL